MGVVACTLGIAVDFDETAIGILSVSSADPFADDLAFGAFANVDHLGAGVGLLMVAGQCNRVEFTG